MIKIFHLPHFGSVRIIRLMEEMADDRVTARPGDQIANAG